MNWDTHISLCRYMDKTVNLLIGEAVFIKILKINYMRYDLYWQCLFVDIVILDVKKKFSRVYDNSDCTLFIRR